MTVKSSPPPLVRYSSLQEYQRHYLREYCAREVRINTFDGIRVHFSKGAFHHAFFESSSRRKANKAIFSPARAERIDWIRWALQNPQAELYVGWYRRKKKHDWHRRVAVVAGNYVVVIKLMKSKKAFFITAFVAGNDTLSKIRRNPKWK